MKKTILLLFMTCAVLFSSCTYERTSGNYDFYEIKSVSIVDSFGVKGDIFHPRRYMYEVKLSNRSTPHEQDTTVRITRNMKYDTDSYIGDIIHIINGDLYLPR